MHQKQLIAKRTLEKKNSIQVKLLQVQHQQLENVLFLLWRHVEYYLTRAPTKTRVSLFYYYLLIIINNDNFRELFANSITFGRPHIPEWLSGALPQPTRNLQLPALLRNGHLRCGFNAAICCLNLATK